MPRGLIRPGSKATLGSATVVLGGVAKGGDLNGYVWAALSPPITLLAGKGYYLVSAEGESLPPW